MVWARNEHGLQYMNMNMYFPLEKAGIYRNNTGEKIGDSVWPKRAQNR